MAGPYLFDRVRETSTTTGTGSFTTSGVAAAGGYQRFQDVYSTNDTLFYVIVNQSATEWEVGLGTFTRPTTLARTTVLTSSNANALVSFSAGTKDVWVDAPAAMMARLGMPSLSMTLDIDQLIPANSQVNIVGDDTLILNGHTLTTDTGAKLQRIPVANAFPSYPPTVCRGYIDGLVTSFISSTSLAVAAGMAADSIATIYMPLASSMTKTTGRWAAGTGNGGFLDAGAISGAQTTYHWYLIYSPLGNTVDVGFSSSLTPTLPAGYTLYRWIMSHVWTGSAWIQFIQNDDEVLYNAVQDTGTIFTLSTTAQLETMTVPTGIQVLSIFNFRVVANATPPSIVYLSSPDQSDQAVASAGIACATQQTGSANLIAGWFRIRTNTSGQIRARANNATTSGVIGTMGFVHSRGKNQ